MKNVTQHTGQLHIIKRLANSANGNPRYLLSIDGFTCRTKPDASDAYGLVDLEGKRVTAIIGTHYGKASASRIEATK